MPPGAYITISTKNSPRYSSHALVMPDSATVKNTVSTAPMIGPKNVPMPPIKAASSTAPERTADTFSAVTISKLMHDSAPAMPAKNADRITTR